MNSNTDSTEINDTEVPYKEHAVPRSDHFIYAREYSGEDPPIVLMHGFPDNHHLYDRLVPRLAPERRVITFDFLGWGASDKPSKYPYTADNQTWDLHAEIEYLDLDEAVLVAHDASGPPAIDWALWHPDQTAMLVLLNVYYHRMPSLRPPEAIWLFSTPGVRSIARLISGRFGLQKRLHRWQLGRFIRDREMRERFIPLFYEQFDSIPSTTPAFFRLNTDLLATVRSREGSVDRLRAFERPVKIVFGEHDPYLNAGVARGFDELFPNSKSALLPTAKHYPQIDEPDAVAQQILSAPGGESVT